MSGCYHGQPMAAHLPLPIDTPHFDRWLEIFAETAREICPAPAAAHFLERACRIAESLELGIAARKGEIRPKRATGRDPAPVLHSKCRRRDSRRRLSKPGSEFMNQGRSCWITRSEDGFVVDAELVAGELGLPPDTFWQEVKRGIVYSVVERGEGEDAGRVRLTFRYRAQSWSIILEETAQ